MIVSIHKDDLISKLVSLLTPLMNDCQDNQLNLYWGTVNQQGDESEFSQWCFITSNIHLFYATNRKKGLPIISSKLDSNLAGYPKCYPKKPEAMRWGRLIKQAVLKIDESAECEIRLRPVYGRKSQFRPLRLQYLLQVIIHFSKESM